MTLPYLLCKLPAYWRCHMHSLLLEYISQIKFDSKAVMDLRAIAEFKGKQELFFRQTPEILKTLQKVSVVESTESSNRIEGIFAPHKRIEGIILKSTEPRNRSEKEIAGYRDALNLIHESAKNMPFSENVILQIHSLIHRYMPDSGGYWKIEDNEITERNEDGTTKRVRFTPPPALVMSTHMSQLVDFYKRAIKEDKNDPLVVIPLAVLDFLCIHPFSDGNGRVSRLLTLLLLYHFEYEVGRFISLERIFEESKETYYEALESSSQRWHESQHNVMPWLQYFWGVLIRAYKDLEMRVGKIRKGKGSKTDQIRQAVERKFNLFSISDIERECAGISRDMVRRVLRQMRDEGLIQNTGKGRNAKWKRKDL